MIAVNKIKIYLAFLLIIMPIVIALPFQSHPGSEITDEITVATLSCSNIQQSDIADDSDFCVDADTRCTAPGLCNQLCLDDACIGSFAEINSSGPNQDQMCNATDTCDQLCIDDICISSFSGLTSSSNVVGACTQGFIREIDEDGEVICQKIISADILAETITSSNILDGTIAPADLDADAGYCVGGYCAGDLTIPGKLEITTSTSDTSLLVASASNHAIMAVRSPGGKYAAIDFYDLVGRKWGMGMNPASNFYIDDSFGTVFTILSGGNVGIGTLSPQEKLDVNGNIVATGIAANTIDAVDIQVETIVASDTICDSNGCIGEGLWLQNVGGDIYLDTGKVGIGTSSPGAKLEVVGGSIKATDGLIIETKSSDPTSGLVDGRMWLVTS